MRCMQNRPDWAETQSFSTIFNFKWQPLSRGIKFNLLSLNGLKQMVNHFENHYEITTKDNLFKNLRDYNEAEVFDHVPITFLIEAHSETFSEDLDKFKSVFKILKEFNHHDVEGQEHIDMIDDINDQINNLHWIKIKNTRGVVKIKLPYSHFDGYNIWFLKVTNLNRGRGIYIFNDLDKMMTLIKELRDGIILSNNQEVELVTDQIREKPPSTFSNLQAVPNKIKSSTFVIQKYIEKAITVHKRKFDVRVWVLATHEKQVYFFKEGYLRTSSEDFSLDESTLDKMYVHLTNNAVQK